MGCCDSPGIFSAALYDDLENFESPGGSKLVQYIDDLLLCSESKQACQADTVALLQYLAAQGHKVSLSKLQWIKQEVTFLGHIISHEGRKLSDNRIQAILKIPKPITKKQMMAFLGITGYCRQWLPDYAQTVQPLQSMTHDHGLRPTDTLTWTEDGLASFVKLKQALTAAPTLGLPDPHQPFTQTVCEKDGFMSSVLLQKHGGKLRPVAYFSVFSGCCSRRIATLLKSCGCRINSSTSVKRVSGISETKSFGSSCSFIQQRAPERAT